MYLRSSFYFFFFKQKTAYEMRISDWSSDVCSSDLLHYANSPLSHSPLKLPRIPGVTTDEPIDEEASDRMEVHDEVSRFLRLHQIGRASCRERVCQYV